jgi:hypothetical protein
LENKVLKYSSFDAAGDFKNAMSDLYERLRWAENI